MKTILSDLGKTLLPVVAIVIALCVWVRMEMRLNSINFNVADKDTRLWQGYQTLSNNHRTLNSNQEELLKFQNVIYTMHVRDISNIVDVISSIRETLNTKQDKP